MSYDWEFKFCATMCFFLTDEPLFKLLFYFSAIQAFRRTFITIIQIHPAFISYFFSLREKKNLPRVYCWNYNLTSHIFFHKGQ